MTDHGPQRQPDCESIVRFIRDTGYRDIADRATALFDELARLREENERLLSLIAEGAEFVTLFSYNDGHIYDLDTIEEAQAWIAKVMNNEHNT